MNDNNTQIADVIDLAVENLEHCPWGQSSGRAADQKICAEDAIWMAVRWGRVLTAKEYWTTPSDALEGSEDLESHVANLRLADVVTSRVRRSLGLSTSSLWQWNDAWGRTKQEVIDAFKATAKDLRNEASPT